MPREHVVRVGAANVSDEELVAVLLRTGSAQKNVLTLSQDLLIKYPLSKWPELTVNDWRQIPGIDVAKATTLVAAMELGERAVARKSSGPSRITTPESALPFLAQIRNQKKEHLVALYLNARLQVIHQETLFVGTVNASLTHPREVFAPAIEHAAIAVIIAHNHPSGSTTASPEDITITKQLLAAAQTLQLTLLDHLIVTGSAFASMRQMGSIPEWSASATHASPELMRDKGSDHETLMVSGSRAHPSISYAVLPEWHSQ